MEPRKKIILNPDLSVGDRVKLYAMEEETSVSPGTKGTVIGVDKDPFQEGVKIYRVKWENGSTLSLLSDCDMWTKIKSENIAEAKEESPEKYHHFFSDNRDLFDTFDLKFLRKYLIMVQKSGIINMFGSAPLLYAGKTHIDRYYGENPPDEDAFQEVLDNADVAKNKMIEGTIKFMEKKNIPMEIEKVNRLIQKFASKVVGFYATFY